MIDRRRLPLHLASRRLAPTCLVLLAAAGPLAAQDPATNERTSNWPDGSPRERYTVDEQGQKHGKLSAWAENGTLVLEAVYAHGRRHGAWREWTDSGQAVCARNYQQDQLHGSSKTFHPDGSLASSGSYRAGLRHGKWIDVDADNARTRSAAYRDGQLHGALRVERDRHVLTRQVWQHGELVKLDGLEPFPTPKQDLLAQLRDILATPAEVDPADPKAGLRHAALMRLCAYRHLCGLRHADMELNTDWNELCDAAAEVCRQNGKIDHHPAQPAGFDDARYRQGQAGAGNGNLAIGGTLADSVDSYMDDSDPSNIDRIGHRRWCLNPAMKRTAFGTDGSFHAMWSMDASGKGARGLPGIYYPPRGHVPVDLFSSRRAFSIGLTRGGTPKPDELRASIRPLDADHVPGEPLELDALHLAAGGYGTGACIVFRARSLVVEPGRSYLVEVSTDGGKSLEHRYVVAFCEPVVARR